MTVATDESLPRRVLEDWILDTEPLEGPDWEQYCLDLGLDPELLSEQAERARRRHPRLRCGHYDIPSNTYLLGGRLGASMQGRKGCRTCRGRDRVKHA